LSQSRINRKVTPFAQIKNHLADAMKDAVERPFPDVARDNSPKLDPLILRDTMENVLPLNLSDLAHEMQALTNELPIINDPQFQLLEGVPREGYLMALAFETGRRYMLLVACQLLAEEVDLLPTLPETGPPTPVLMQ
jgi:hypothetical protein